MVPGIVRSGHAQAMYFAAASEGPLDAGPDCCPPADSHLLVHTLAAPVPLVRTTHNGSLGLLQPSFILKQVTNSVQVFAQ